MTHGNSTGMSRSAVIDFIAGSLGGTALVLVGQPFDTVKVKMQTFPGMYEGMIQCFRKTWKNEGFFRGLYAGTIPSIAANVAENSVLFAGYGFCQRVIMKVTNKPDVKELTLFENALAGFFAAFGSSLTLCPTELIKCKLQAAQEMYALNRDLHNNTNPRRIGPVELTRDIIRRKGITGLFRGLNSTIVREMPGYFFFFGGYEGTRELLRGPNQSKDDIGPIKTMVAGAVGGAIFWIIIFPVDVVKSRMQITSDNTTAFDCFCRIAKKEGRGALYNGLLPSVIRTIPATATLFLVYENSKKVMNSFWGE